MTKTNGFLGVCADASPHGQPFDSAYTDRDRRASISSWFLDTKAVQYSLMNPDAIAGWATYHNPERRADALIPGKASMLFDTGELIAAVLDAHAAGFSTTRGDLLRDLLP